MKQKLQSLVRKIFLSAGGGLRPGWRAALGVLVALAAYFAALRGLAALFGALFDAWGLTTANLTRAPGWAQSVVRWHSDFCYALAYGAGIAAGILWARRFSVPADGAAENHSEASARSLDAEAAKSRHTSATAKTAKACVEAFTRPLELEEEKSRRFSVPADAAVENCREASAQPSNAEAKNTRRMDTRKFTLFAAALGLAMGGGLGALALWTDSMRLETPWRGPSIALAQLTALIVLALGRLLSEILTKRLCFDALRMRSRRAAWIVSVALATALNLRAISVLGVLNALLLSMVGCALYERGGLSASAVLQTVWTAAATLLFGFPGMSASASAVWPLYHVSDAWLTGGSAGPMGGAWFAMLLLAALLALLRRPLIDAIRRQMTRKTEK